MAPPKAAKVESGVGDANGDDNASEASYHLSVSKLSYAEASLIRN